MLGMRLRKVAIDDRQRMRTDELGDLSEAAVIVATVGTTAMTAVDRLDADRRRLRAGGNVAARRRRLRRHGDGLPGVPLGVRRRRARRLAGRQRPQVDAHADGLLAAVDAPARGLARRLQPDPRVPAHPRRRGRAVAQRVRPRARPPLPRAEAVGGAPLPRPQRPAGSTSAPESRWPQPFESGSPPSRDGSCARRATSRVVCFRADGRRRATRSCAARQRGRRDLHLPRGAHGRSRSGSPSASATTEADVERAWEVLRARGAPPSAT